MPQYFAQVKETTCIHIAAAHIDYDQKEHLDTIMNDPVPPVPLTPIVQIGIRGLPNLTNSMISRGLYVLIAETPSARFPMLAGNLGSALKDELPCAVIVPANP